MTKQRGAYVGKRKPVANPSPVVQQLFQKAREKGVADRDLAGGDENARDRANNWRRGFVNPSLKSLENAARALGCHIVLVPDEYLVNSKYEYFERSIPYKSGMSHEDVLDPSEGWEPDITKGREGWERFDNHEVLYFRRLKRPINLEVKDNA